jgi:hypothetical protein
MPTIHYELLQSHPEVEELVDQLDDHIELYFLMKTEASTNPASALLRDSHANILIKAAAHFYGLSLADAGCVEALIEQMRAFDQEKAA